MTPFGRPPGVYIEAISDGWNLVKQDLGTWIGAAVVYMMVTVFSSVVSAFIQGGGSLLTQHPAVGNQAAGIAINFLAGGVGQVLLYGMCRMATQVARGHPIQFGDIAYGFQNFGSSFGTCILVGLAIGFGMIACIIPGIYLAGALALVPMVAVDQGVGVNEAFRVGYETFKPYAWQMLGVMFVAGLLQVAGALCCGVGVLFTFPVYCAVIGLHYSYFFPEEGALVPDYAPPMG